MNLITVKSLEEITDEADYDEAVNLGKRIQEDIDRGRWVIGDLALRLETIYGKDSVGEFAKDIQVSKGRVQEYRTMSQYYNREVRQYIADNFAVNWSILRIAKRFKDIESSIDFLSRCADKGVLTVDDTARLANEVLGRSPKPQKLARADFMCTRSEEGKITFHIDNIPPDIQELITIGDVYTLDIYEIIAD